MVFFMFDPKYWADKANEFMDMEKYDDAINCYEKILEYYPSDSFALSMIGSCHRHSGRLDNALIYVNKALDINPRDSFLWFNKGMVYYEYKMYTDAIECYDKAILFQQDHSTSWYFKGWCYFDLDNIEKAIECFEISYNIDFDQGTRKIIDDLKQMVPYSSSFSSSNMIECPNCGSRVNSSAINCGFCGHRLSSGGVKVNTAPPSGMKECPNCGVMLRKNKKVCPKCNYNFKKSKIDTPKVKKPKVNKPKVNKPINPKHFDDGIVCFDYPDYYSKDFNSKYNEIGVLASFKIGSNYNFDSAFAIFDGESISEKIPDFKFKDVIKKSLNSEILDINRYSFAEKERIIIKIINKNNNNIEYRGYVPEIGFSVLFIIPDEKEYLFDEKCISTVVNSLERSTGKSIIDEKSISTTRSSKKSFSKSIPKQESKTCPNCGSENPNDSNFCMECGMKLDISNDVNFCIYCGTEVVPGSKFCMNCGKLIEY